jgi:YD repeat-containing protein
VPASAWVPSLPLEPELPAAGPPGYELDPEGRPLSVTDPDGGTRRFEYDGAGRLVRRIGASGGAVRYGDGFLEADDGCFARVARDGNLIRLESEAAVTELVLDDAGRVAEERQTVDGVTCVTTYGYDGEGRCTRIVPPGSAEAFLVDHGRLEIRAESGRVYLHAAGGEVRLENGVAERLTVDGFGRPARVQAAGRSGSAILDLEISYDEAGRISGIGGHAVAYDGDRVLGAPAPGRPSGRDGVRYRHDTDGNRVERRGPDGRTRYRYDGRGRLAAVDRDGDTVVRYRYDALGRRVRRETAAGVTVLHYDVAGNLLAETDPGGRALATYLCLGVRCLGKIDGAVGGPAAEWYHLDHLGSAWAVTDAEGAVVGRRRGPLDLEAPGPTMRRFRDPATGFFDFGARDLDPESGCFTTPDDHTFAPDDIRLLVDGRCRRAALRDWSEQPALRDRYGFCLGDPVNNVDLDGHSAWWFFFTIPSSLIWAIPNTVIAFILIVLNLIFEIIGWIAWPFVAAARHKWDLSSYPWGLSAQTGSDPPNPFDLDDRNHFWFGLDASAREGVPWALINGSFCSVGRAFTLGNVLFIEDIVEAGDDGEKNERYVVPNDPDVQLTLKDALHQHEMQHVFQYAFLGPLFHCLPIPLLVRIIGNAIQHHDLDERAAWWQRIDLGEGLTWTVGGLVWLLTIGHVKPEDVGTWINPATWWQHILPFRWVEIASQAISFNSLFPLIGVYELDLLFRGGQDHSWFERNAGASSGDTYGTVIEAEHDEIYVGQFVRIVGADVRTGPGSGARRTITWTVAPDAPLPAGAPGAAGTKLDTTGSNPATNPNIVDLDKNNVAPVQVVNGGGLYFHTTTAGKYSVTGTGSTGVGVTSETVEITVKDVEVGVVTDVFACRQQTITVKGDGDATYSARLKTNKSGATLSPGSGLGYTAGQNAGTDTIEIVARYKPDAGPFATYGDNGTLASFDWVVKTIDVVVKLPTVTPASAEIFVGESVTFTVDDPPLGGSSTSLVPGSRFDLDSRTFFAGRGAIAAQQVETVTLQYGCRTVTVGITVKPITVTATPGTVSAGGTAQLAASGGTAPYTFDLASAGTSGPSVDANGHYTAGTTAAPATDVITVTDKNGGRGTVSIAVTP